MEQFDRLVSIMKTLRSENGCPWDKEQTYDTIRPCLLEETHEVIEAIINNDREALKEELGDLLLQVAFLSQLAAEEGAFTIQDVVEGINDKLVRRHPHVFGEEIAHTSSAVLKRWEEIKAEERKKKESRKSMLDGVPKTLPALTQAYKLQGKAARAGFDFPDAGGAYTKALEEFAEFDGALQLQNAAALEEELGDLLFSIVNLARKLDIDAEGALLRSNKKFKRRFEYIEERYRKKGSAMHSASLEELDAVYEEGKRKERKR